MANEGVIKLTHPVASLGTITCKILKPDDTVRDGQTAIALTDSGHDNLYSNAGAVTIEAGDSVLYYQDGVNITGKEYQEEATVVNEDDCKADVSALATGVDLATHNDSLLAVDGKVDAIQGDVTDIKTETDKLDEMIEEDSAGNKFTEKALEEAPTAEMDATELAAAMKAITGITEGGTWTWEKIMKITTAFMAGDWRLDATGTKQELMDAEDGSTVILEQDITRSPSAGNKYRDILVKI